MTTRSSDDPDLRPRDYDDFYRTTATRTFTVALRMSRGDEHVAHDATQEAYESMLRYWERWATRTIRDAGRYVIKIAVHKVTDVYRRNVDIAWPDDYEPPNHETGYDEILGQPLRRSLTELIDRQPDRRRAVAMLFFLDDFTPAEIADILRITESTVRTHVERMRVLLKPLVDIDRNPRGGERS